MNRHHAAVQEQAGRSERGASLVEYVRHQRGASLVEYVLMLSLILLVALAGVSAFGSTLGDNVDDSASRIAAAGP